MAALSFAVHIDKENETPASLVCKGKNKTFGLRQGKLSQQTPRKALFDVNNELQLSSKVPRNKELCLPGPMKNPVKARMNIIREFENQNPDINNKKPQFKKEQKISKKTKGPQVQNKVIPAVKIQSLQEPQAEKKHYTDEDEEWDHIFPRHERLSTYIDQLFSWRPPCLFGQVPDSDESDNSEPEDFDFDVIVDPLEVDGFPENASLSDLVVPLPEEDCEQSTETQPQSSQTHSQSLVDQTASLSDSVLLQSPDQSLSLGSLEVLQDSSPAESNLYSQSNSTYNLS